MDLGGHRGEQRGDRGVFGDGFGDQVHGAGAVEEGGDVEPVAGPGSTLAARAGSAMNARARDMTIRTVAAVLWASPRSSASVCAH